MKQPSTSLVSRIRKVKGQVEGIERMLREEKYCIDIINQIHAVRRALDRVALLLIENHVKTCVKEKLTQKDQTNDIIEELVQTLDRYLKT